MRETKGSVREMSAASGESKCEVTSHGLHGKMQTNRNRLIHFQELFNSKSKLIVKIICN